MLSGSRPGLGPSCQAKNNKHSHVYMYIFLSLYMYTCVVAILQYTHSLCIVYFVGESTCLPGDKFRLEPESEADERNVSAARNAASEEFAARTRRIDFARCDSIGLHATRVADRLKALQLRPHKARGGSKDAEGLEQADVEAISHPTWKKWVKSLDEDDRRYLRIWRGGAIYTPTRDISAELDRLVMGGLFAAGVHTQEPRPRTFGKSGFTMTLYGAIWRWSMVFPRYGGEGNLVALQRRGG
jgi:hypothetical protein